MTSSSSLEFRVLRSENGIVIVDGLVVQRTRELRSRHQPRSSGPLVQTPSRPQVLHPAVSARVEEGDEALPGREVAVADRTQWQGRGFFERVGVVEAHLSLHPERDARFVRYHPKRQGDG